MIRVFARWVVAAVIAVGPASNAWAQEQLVQIYVVRHGETESAPADLKAIHLTETGRKRSALLVPALAGIRVSHLFASHTVRTRETLKISHETGPFQSSNYRRRDMAALGAEQRALRATFVRDGLILACIGVLLGVPVALVLTRLMDVLLFGVTRVDPVAYLTVSVAMIGVAALASYVPARRASCVDPLVALRHE